MWLVLTLPGLSHKPVPWRAEQQTSSPQVKPPSTHPKVAQKGLNKIHGTLQVSTQHSRQGLGTWLWNLYRHGMTADIHIFCKCGQLKRPLWSHPVWGHPCPCTSRDSSAPLGMNCSHCWGWGCPWGQPGARSVLARDVPSQSLFSHVQRNSPQPSSCCFAASAFCLSKGNLSGQFQFFLNNFTRVTNTPQL